MNQDVKTGDCEDIIREPGRVSKEQDQKHGRDQPHKKVW